ncbi:MAG: ATP-grasp domain-containing protein [Syntrophotaleaceae bacterium]
MGESFSRGSGKGKRAVLYKSKERFEAFRQKLEYYGIEYTILDFDSHEWMEFDYSKVDFAIYYPSFENASSSPMALYKVHDNIAFLHSEYPELDIYPDPGIVKYYNDKYRQFLFLKKHDFPIPDTIPLYSKQDIEAAETEFGYPMILKNRFGAGGGTVFKVEDRKELWKYFRLSQLDLFNTSAFHYFGKQISKRLFWYFTIKERRMPYPFLSPPLLAQRFEKIDRDLKTVVGKGRVVEGHWRLQASQDMWKMNIDGGGTGVWSEIPQKALELSMRLAEELNSTWLNIDLIYSRNHFLITEFSPVWHHYHFKEKPSFIYKDDYNLDPLEDALDLEKIIIEEFLK